MGVAAAAFVAVAACGGPLSGGLMPTPVSPGSETVSVTGDQRSYLVHVPETRAAKGDMPLLLVLHGGFSTAERMKTVTGFDEVADRYGFIVAYLQGRGRNWKDGRSPQHFTSRNIDIPYVKAVIEALTQSHPVDTSRIYATGFSNGSIMSQRLACEMSETFAAVAPISGPMAVEMGERCEPERAISVLYMHGTADELIEFDGGLIVGGRLPGKVWSAERTLDFWRQNAGCRDTGEVSRIDRRDDGTSVTITRYDRCEAGAEVMMVTIVGGGHTWPDEPDKVGRSSRSGRVTHDIDGSEFIWKFLSSQSL